jgi:hypothetical protein
MRPGERTVAVDEGEREVRFAVTFAEGDGELAAYFTGQRKAGRPVSPFSVEVEYLGPPERPEVGR